KMIEFPVLEIKQGIPLSNYAIIIMEAKIHEKLPTFIKIYEASLRKLNNARYQVNDETNKKSSPEPEITRKINPNNDYKFITVGKNEKPTKTQNKRLIITEITKANETIENSWNITALSEHKGSTSNTRNLKQIQLSSTAGTAEKYIVQSCQVNFTNNKIKESETENKLKQLNSSPSNNTNANSETILPEY
ncbi:hypothetical protein BB560_005710, partial [Smittium megazygosporum]